MISINTKTGCWTGDCGDPYDSQLRLVAVGDVCPARGREYDEVFTAGPEAIAAAYGDVIEELRRKDLSVANLELALSDRGEPIIKCGPNLIGPPAAIEGVTFGGFDVMKMANNHTLDYGQDALADTIELVRANGMEVLGQGADAEDAARPLIIERQGLRIAMLAFAENEFCNATRTSPGGCPLDPGTNCTAIRRARDGCDLLIVCVHGGSELCPIPSPRMMRDYRSFIDAGADAVIGDHAHTVQGMELHAGKPIIYNMGNFFFWGDPAAVSPQWWKRIFVRLTFSGRSCTRLDVHPFEVDFQTAGLRLLTGEKKEAFLGNLNRLSEIIADGDLHERFWNTYCLTRGESYRSSLAEKAEAIIADQPDKHAAAVLRHFWSCEAHADVIEGYTELIRLGMEGEDFGVADELDRLMS